MAIALTTNGISRNNDFLQLLLIFWLASMKFTLRTVAAQDNRSQTVNTSFLTNVIPEPNIIETEIKNWWYDDAQKNIAEKYVHEYKGPNASSEIDANDQNIVAVLEQTHSKSAATHSQTSMMVQFYTSTADCGPVCITLIDHYLQLAMHVNSIIDGMVTSTNSTTSHNGNIDTDQRKVSFHAVNCAIYIQLCQQNEVKHYPTFRVYKYGTTSLSYKSIFDVSYQHLHPYEVLEKFGITEDDALNNEADVFVDTTSEKDNMHESDHSINISFNEDNSLLANHLHATMSYHHHSRQELLSDIHIALDYTLRKVIFAKRNTSVVHIPHTKHKSDLTVTEQEVLKSFLLLLQRTMPTTDEHLKNMIKAVIDSYMFATKNHAYMDAILNDHLPLSKQYSERACPKHDITLINNPYGCVMWDLLFLISVGTVDYNLQSYDATEMIHPAASLHTIYEYIQLFGLSTVLVDQEAENSFIGDDFSRMEFIKLYNDCSFMNRCQQLPDAPKYIYDDKKDQVSKEYIVSITTTYAEWKFVPLYLANIRNSITQKANNLSKWPPIAACLVCWNDDMYNTENLNKYLKVEYGHVDAITVTYRHELSHYNTLMTKEKSKSHQQESNLESEEMTQPIDVERQEQLSHETSTAARSRTEMEENKDEFFTNSQIINKRNLLVRPKPSILTMRHGSICILLLVGTFLRWVFIRRQDPRKADGHKMDKTFFIRRQTTTKEISVQSNHINNLDGSQRTIKYTFDNDSDHTPKNNSPNHRMLSPRKRQLMNRRFVLEQEQKKQEQVQNLHNNKSLEHLEESVHDGDDSIDRSINYHHSEDQISSLTSGLSCIPQTPPPPLYKCDNRNTTLNAQLRQRRSPIVPIMAKPKVTLS
jgi:hypothetical protein